jgi:hypothetical protein
LSFSPSCSGDPGSGWTTNWRGMLTVFGMAAARCTRRHQKCEIRWKIGPFCRFPSQKPNFLVLFGSSRKICWRSQKIRVTRLSDTKLEIIQFF